MPINWGKVMSGVLQGVMVIGTTAYVAKVMIDEVDKLVAMPLEDSLELMAQRVIGLDEDQWRSYRGLLADRHGVNAATLISAGQSVRQGLANVNKLIAKYPPAHAAQMIEGLLYAMDDIERFGFAYALQWKADSGEFEARAILGHLRKLLAS